MIAKVAEKNEKKVGESTDKELLYFTDSNVFA